MARWAEDVGAPNELEVLQGICHAFGSVSDPDEATESLTKWVTAAVGEVTAVRIILPNRAGRLEGVDDPEFGLDPERGRWARQYVFESSKEQSFELDQPPGHVVMVIPLVVRGEVQGVVELVGKAAAIEARRQTLDAVISQSAIAMKNVRDKAEHSSGLQLLKKTTAFTRDLIKASNPEEALRAAVKFCHDHFELPIAAWYEASPRQLELVDYRDIPEPNLDLFRRSMGTLPPWDDIPPTEVGALISLFKAYANVDSVTVIQAGKSLLLAGGGSPSLLASLEVLGSLVEDVLYGLETVARAERIDQGLDLGLALTAHEVRSPLLATKAAIERFMVTSGDLNGEGTLLQRSKDQLADLAQQVDGLLRWAVGGAELEFRGVDLVAMMSRVIESTSIDADGDRVVLFSPDRVIIEADAPHLQGAISNLLRNALTYSPPDGKVEVHLEKWGRVVRIGVHDSGPGIPDSERHAIFEPLVRGSAASFNRSGRGLGLFIARRIVEAHRGTIWAHSDERGTVFHVRLPVEQERVATRPSSRAS